MEYSGASVSFHCTPKPANFRLAKGGGLQRVDIRGDGIRRIKTGKKENKHISTHCSSTERGIQVARRSWESSEGSKREAR